MRTPNIRWLVLASVAALSLSTTSLAQESNDGSPNTTFSTFITSDRDLAFALNVPSDSPSDLFFTLVMPIHITWGAVGLGSDKMANALVLLMYTSASGQNVTLSPRIAYGHSEPVYSPDIKVEALPGTGLVNETTYVYNGRCTNCRSWTNGQIDVQSKAQSMIYASGESGDLKSDNVDEPLRYHWNYGSFTMDLVHATGVGGVPVIVPSNETRSEAAVQGLSKEGKKDIAALVHAIIMVLCFVGIYPFGILILRLGNWVRWHAINQGVALLLVTIGASLGFKISGNYNRSKKYNTAHQVIGILIFIFVFVQFTLGFLHHRSFKKTQQTTKMAPVHVWLGRLIIILGVANGFTGFPLALSPGYNYALLGLVLFIFPALVLTLITKKFIQKRWKKNKEAGNEPGGYSMEPWRADGTRQQQQPPPGYGSRSMVTADPSHDALGLSGAGAGAGMAQHSRRAGGPELGVQQSAREYV